MTSHRLPFLISARELHQALAGSRPPVVIDVRVDSKHGNSRARYEAGHIPGAVFADTLTDLAAPPAPGRGLRPIPSEEVLQAAIRRWGIGRESEVVVYDDKGGLTAGRAWWLLSWAGIKNVRLLDGGYRVWLDEGIPVSDTAPSVLAGDFIIDPGQLPAIEVDGIESALQAGILVDVRSPKEYSGAEPMPVGFPAGHIPGAVNVPMDEGLTEAGLHKSAEEIRARYAAAGVDGSRPVTVYCGAGGGAAHEVFVLRSLGFEAALFMGSWSAWSSDPTRPIATGAGWPPRPRRCARVTERRVLDVHPGPHASRLSQPCLLSRDELAPE